jgi:hypothetical protein
LALEERFEEGGESGEVVLDEDDDPVPHRHLIGVDDLAGVARPSVIPDPDVDVVGRECRDGLLGVSRDPHVVPGVGHPVAGTFTRRVEEVAVDEESASELEDTQKNEQQER